MQPQKLSNMDVIFPTDITHLMPKYNDIPLEFKQAKNKYVKLTEKWFYQGIAKSELKPFEGIDSDTAFRHLKAIMGSFDPSHEHKITAVAYLMSLWFEAI